MSVIAYMKVSYFEYLQKLRDNIFHIWIFPSNDPDDSLVYEKKIATYTYAIDKKSVRTKGTVNVFGLTKL